MQQISTPELLVKHLYNETNNEESTFVENALANDTVLQQEFKRLQKTKSALDEQGGETPSSTVIQNILAFSKEKELSETH